jgi:lipoyl(octanoyl) transferase
MHTVFWPGLVPYDTMCHAMKQCVHDIRCGHEPEQIWYLEHQPVYTCGPAYDAASVAHDLPFPLVRTERGGDITFHGPGQRVVYVMVDLKHRNLDIHTYIHTLEQWIMRTLHQCAIQANSQSCGRGVWTAKGKIASIGLKITSGITWHGFACNVTMASLPPFSAIHPCGLVNQPMACVQTFHADTSMTHVDTIISATCPF